MATGGQKKVAYSLVNVGTWKLESTNSHPYYNDFVVFGNTIIVIDISSDVWNVRLHSLNYGKLLNTHQLESVPCAICLTSKKEICVILLNGLINIISIVSADKSGIISANRTFHMRRSLDIYHDAVGFGDNLVVSGVNTKMMSWCIVSLDDGHIDKIHHICKGALCDESESYVTAKDDVVYISCYIGPGCSDNGVYGYTILDPDECKYIYKHKHLSYPTGITMNQNGFIFVCNSEKSNPSIHQITENCQLVAIFRQGIPPDLLSISWVPERGRFYVTCYDSTDITVFRPESRARVKTTERKAKHQISEKISTIQRKRKIISALKGPVAKKKSDTSQSDEPELTNVKRTDLQVRKEFLDSVRYSDHKVKEMIRNQKIPNRCIMEEAVIENGYSMFVKRALIEMSKLLRGKISEAVGVWCGYKPKNPLSPVFVVTLKDKKCMLDKGKIPEPFADYKIITRYNCVPNNEEKSIVELCGRKSVRSEDVTRVNNCIAAHTESLMREHSNLSIIRACSVKARGYKTKLKVEDVTCIVFYVPVKGIIPVGEKEFPKVISKIVTDVREGEFVLYVDHKSLEYHPKVRMGCCISRCTCQANECTEGKGCIRGTLGGFIDLDETVGCLTAAHVVLVDQGIQTYIKKSDEEKKQFNYMLAKGEPRIEMHQPKQSSHCKSFGIAHTIALEQGNGDTPSVDAAIIQMTDEMRKPDMGSFPDGDFQDIFKGLTKEDPLLFTSGKILDETEINQHDSLVIKFGCTTGLTYGYLNNIETCVRPVNMDSNYCFPIMFGQLEVQSNDQHVFANAGDSGALVFLCVGDNIRNLQAIGMVIGGNTAGRTCVVTPITAIFTKLGLTNKWFKVFSHPIQNEVLHSLSERISSLEQNISSRLITLEQKISMVDTFRDTIEKVGTLEKDIKGIQESLKNMNQPLTPVSKNS